LNYFVIALQHCWETALLATYSSRLRRLSSVQQLYSVLVVIVRVTPCCSHHCLLWQLN